MKNRKRNLTMMAVLVFVCAAVALNWSYNRRWGTPDAEMVIAEDAELTEVAQAFLDFALSMDAADLIRLAGAVPVAAAE